MNTKKFLYAPALFTALALIATSEHGDGLDQ
jgi:hypothetical protein